jgi:hypothetical protein
MRPQSHILRLSLLFAVLFVAFPADAQAYIDAGTGSIIINGLIAAVMGGFFFFRHHLRQLKNRLFGGGEAASNPDASASSNAQTGETPKA